MSGTNASTAGTGGEGAAANGGSSGSLLTPQANATPQGEKDIQQQSANAAGVNSSQAGEGQVNLPYDSGDWRNNLPAEFRDDPNIKTTHTIEALAKSFIHAQKMIGADKVAIPGKHATEEDWQKFYEKIGLPPEDKYEVALPKEAKFIDQEAVKELKPLARKLGVMPKQLDKILEWYEARASKAITADQQTSKVQYEEGVKRLQADWGKAFDQRVGYAQRVIKEHGGDEMYKYFEEKGLGFDTKVMKFLGELGNKLYSEDNVPGDGRSGHSGVYDPATAKEKYATILRDFQHPYHNAEHPNHEAAMKEVQQLFQMAYPS